jgi:Tfp pilus assembly protein PilF
MTTSDARRAGGLVVAMALAFFVGVALAAPDKFGEDVPEEAQRQLNRARSLRHAGHYDRAIAMLHEILAQAPDYYRAHYHLGLTLAESGKLDEAMATFGQAARIKDSKGIKDATLYNAIGWTHFLQGDYEQADAWLERAVRSNEPASREARARAFDNLGIVAMRQGKLSEANAAFRQALALGSEGARGNLAILGKAQADYQSLSKK